MKPKKNENIVEELRRSMEVDRAATKALPILDERWFINEVKPAWLDCNEYDNTWMPATSRQASPYFKTRVELKHWEETVEPDDGNTFVVHHQYLRPFIENRWSDI